MNQAKLAKATTLGVAGIATILLVPMQWLPKCPIHAVTGLLCPGCGIQRATSALLQGDVQAAFEFNQLMFVAPIFIITGAAAKSKGVKWLEWLTIATAAVAMLIFTVVRNI